MISFAVKLVANFEFLTKTHEAAQVKPLGQRGKLNDVTVSLQKIKVSYITFNQVFSQTLP